MWLALVAKMVMAWLAGIAWLVCDRAVLAPLAKPIFGCKIVNGGAPRW